MRWKILTVLFFARMAMAFQFAAIGALGPLYETTFQVTSASLGILIGLYFLPGIVVALPGGSLAARFGDKRVVVFGLALMALGAAIMATGDTWTAQITGRIVAGAGGVFLNVSMTKMVADWFAGREIATAMAVFVNSWPAGIATALMVMPLLADRAGLSMAVWMAFGFILFGICLMLLFYQSPEGPGNAEAPRGTTPKGHALAAVLSAGIAWGLFNASLAMVFSFGPANLVERGQTLVEASAAISIMIWSVMVAGFAGGVISDRTGRPFTLLISATAMMLVGMYYFPVAENIFLVLILLGVATGLPTGVYMSIAARSLRPDERAIGMGIFYTAYYVLFSVSPWIAGNLIDRRGSTAVAFEYGAFLLALALIAVGACLTLQRRMRPLVSAE